MPLTRQLVLIGYGLAVLSSIGCRHWGARAASNPPVAQQKGAKYEKEIEKTSASASPSIPKGEEGVGKGRVTPLPPPAPQVAVRTTAAPGPLPNPELPVPVQAPAAISPRVADAAVLGHDPALASAGPTAPLSPPEPPSPALVMAMHAFLEERPHDAVEHLRAYDPDDQQFILALLPLLAQVHKKGGAHASPGGPERLVVLDVVRSVLEKLRLTAPLVVNKLAFCKKVYGYGKFDPVPAEFKPGDWVHVYGEVQNLADERIGPEEFRTRLAGRVEIRRPDGSLAHVPKVRPDSSEWSRSRRNDFYTVTRFCIPPDLAPGYYTFRVQFTDKITNRRAEGTLDFRVDNIRPTTRKN